MGALKDCVQALRRGLALPPASLQNTPAANALHSASMGLLAVLDHDPPTAR